MKSTAIIILNYNNAVDSVNCVRSVERYNSAPVKYILVDNGSTKAGVVEEIDREMHSLFGDDYIKIEEGEAVPACLPRFTFLVSKVNDGYAAGNNKGLLLAYDDDEIDRILILNSDILFVEDIIPGLKNVADKTEDCAIVSPILYKRDMLGIDYNCARNSKGVRRLTGANFATPFRWLAGGGKTVGKQHKLNGEDISLLPEIVKIDLPSGSCMLIDKELMKAIGSFDAATFLYYEENILGAKLQRRGLSNYIATGLKCIHLGATTTGKSPSKRVFMASVDSQRHYVKNYTRTSWLMMMFYNVSCLWVKSAFNVKSAVKKVIGKK